MQGVLERIDAEKSLPDVRTLLPETSLSKSPSSAALRDLCHDRFSRRILRLSAAGNEEKKDCPRTEKYEPSKRDFFRVSRGIVP